MRCERCSNDHDGLYGSGRFCSVKCARSFSTAAKRNEINVNVSKKLLRLRKCKGCNIEFKPLVSRQLYHSRECKNEAYKSYQLCRNEALKQRGIKAGFTSQKGRWCKAQNSILDVSPSTSKKIIKRLNLACFNCGWNKTSCDIHHIRGKKIENSNHHNNLTYLCPNCHRLVHQGLLDLKTLKTLEEVVGDSWKALYFG